MTTLTATKPHKFDILKSYGDEIVLSIDKNFWNMLYQEYLEDQTMLNNKKKLVKTYNKSLKS